MRQAGGARTSSHDLDLVGHACALAGQAFDRVRRELRTHRRFRPRLGHDLQPPAGRVDQSYFRGSGSTTRRLRRAADPSTSTQDALVPREGPIPTLKELRRRGFKRGLISVCSSDVEEAWDGDRARAASRRLRPVVHRRPDEAGPADLRAGVRAARGVTGRVHLRRHGANDELRGAERVGMRAVCVLPPGRDEPIWPEARGWKPTIISGGGPNAGRDNARLPDRGELLQDPAASHGR